MYTPAPAGTKAGEDFADAFAGTLLFPKTCAEFAYRDAALASPPRGVIRVLQKYADEYMILRNVLYQQVQRAARSSDLLALKVEGVSIRRVRKRHKGPLVSEMLFDPMPPAPKLCISACEHTFKSDFFIALKHMILETAPGLPMSSGY